MNKTISLTFLLLITLQLFGQEYKYVNTETLNVREYAGIDHKVVGQVHKNDKIEVLSNENDWIKIETSDGLIGYVSAKYLTSKIAENKSPKDSEKDDDSWIGLLIALGIIFYALYKIKNFLSGLFGGNISTSMKSSKKESRSYSSEPVSNTQKPKFICKYCGYEDASLNSLTFHTCHRSPTKKHVPFEGGVKEKYICKHCGYGDKSLNSLTFHTCHRSPTKKHEPFEGGIREKYICKHCGYEDRSLNSLTFHTCHRSPTKKHQPHF